MKEENTTNKHACNQKLADILKLVLQYMMEQGTVKMHISAYAASYTVKGVDSGSVHVDKDSPNGFEQVQMHLIASPMAKMHIRTDAVELPEVTVVSHDGERSITYTFMVAVPL